MPPIRLAVIGAGIFARTQHLPALQALRSRFEIAAIYSRTEESARALADLLPTPPDISTDLDALLARDDIDAVDIVLPINVLPGVVEAALRAGKHVLSEKPIAPDVTTARHLIAQYGGGVQVWMIGENWRYAPAIVAARNIVKSGVLGGLLSFNWPIYVRMDENNPYYGTAWRRAGDFPGGFLLDGGVHHVATVRAVLGDIAAVSAFTRSVRPDLPPADTLSAALHLTSGLTGTYTATYAAAFPRQTFLEIMGERGVLHVNRDTLEYRLFSDDTLETPAFTPGNGVKEQFSAFAEAIAQGLPHDNTPEQAFGDLAAVAAMLESARTGQHITPDTL